MIATSWLAFDRPAALALALVALAWRLWRGRGGAMRGGGLSPALQSLALGAALLCLAGPRIATPGAGEWAWIVLRDVSASARGQREDLLPLPGERAVETLDFARRVAPAHSDAGEDATNLAPALRTAVGRAARAAGVVVWSDGRFTDRAWLAAAEAVGRAGLETFIVAMESPPPDARIAELTARRTGGKVALRVSAAANAGIRRRLTVWRADAPDAPLLDREIQFRRGEPATVRISDETPPGRAAVYRACLVPGDTLNENDAASVVVAPEWRRAALISPPSEALATQFAGGLGVAVDVLAPADAPREPAGWVDYAGVALFDTTGERLDAPQRRALAEHVRGGGGLVLVGAGPHRSPADRDDALNAVAALVADPRLRRPLDVRLALDASGSMAAGGPDGTTRFRQAAAAVLALRRHVSEADALRVIAFAEEPRTIYDSAGGPADFAALGDAVEGVRPGGTTNAAGALRAAIAAGPRDDTDGLVLLVSDLEAEVDVGQLAAELADGGWRLAVVLCGDGADASRSLGELARRLDAPLARARRLDELADILASLLSGARQPALRRGISEIPWAEAFGLELHPPALETYVLCAAAPHAEVLLRAGGDPLLARREVGLGRSVGLALPLADGENAAWADWVDLPRLIAAAMRWSLGNSGDEGLVVELARDGERLGINVEADGPPRPRNLLRLTALVRPAGEAAETVERPIEQVGPGRYELRMRMGTAAALAVRDEDAGRIVWRGTAPETCSAEFTGGGVDWDNLRRLARLTGGRIVRSEHLPGMLRAKHAEQLVALTPYLIGLSLVAMLAEWIVSRRVGWKRQRAGSIWLSRRGSSRSPAMAHRRE